MYKASDIWALATTLFAFAFGRKPYNIAKTIEGLKKMVLNYDIETYFPTDEELKKQDIPKASARIIKDMLMPLFVTDPDTRIANFQHLAEI